MPDTPDKFYLTTPIYYVNARPHIGHAYSTIAADVLARRHRLLGDDTFFLTGTDEHGQKVQRSAEAAGVPPQQFADEVSATFRALWDRMGITYSDYIRTTDPRHKRGVQKLFTELHQRGFIYLSTYTGAYCVSDEAFVDLPVGTPCPDCSRPLELVTEENFFFKLSAFQQDLIDLIESGELEIRPDSVKNEVLSFLVGRTFELIHENGDIKENLLWNAKTTQEAMEIAVSKGILRRSPKGVFYVPEGLRDLSISRSSFTWGIPVPESVQKAAGATQNHVVYVWLDALANYITAIGYGSDDPADQAKFAKYWPADIHLVGKEITRFHCVYWPAFLMAAGLPTPKSVVANGWLLFEESKMSKSRGNVVRTETILDAFGPLCPPVPVSLDSTGLQPGESAARSEGALAPGLATPTKAQQDLFATDVLRYFLLREIPFGQDGSFGFDALITRYNADLANGYGNLVSRTLNMLAQYRNGVVSAVQLDLMVPLPGPQTLEEELNYQVITTGVRVTPREKAIPVESAIIRLECFNTEKGVASHFKANDLTRAAERLKELASSVDGYVSHREPWKQAKLDTVESRSHVDETLYTALQAIRIITALLYPIMPYATASVWAQLGLGSIEQAARNGELKNLQWGGLKPGTKLGALAPIFPRADKGLAQIMTDMENPTAPAAEPANADAKASEPTAESLNAVSPSAGASPVAPAVDSQAAPAANPPLAPQITIDDFAKVDLRVAKVLVAERIPKADKLLRLEVDLGFEKRQVLAGIAEYYTPESLIGRKVVIVANLAPRKMRGLESNGMVVAASVGEQGAPVLVGFADDVELGARLK